jgi:selenocysteine lyase/cysteine desulfurase
VPGVFYTYAWNLTGEVLPLPQVAEIAHAHGVPVLVDAAAEVRVHPHTLREGEEVVVAERIREVLGGA